MSSTGPCWTRCSPSSLPGVERVSPGPGPTSAGSARDREPGGSQASAGTVARPSARPQLPLSLGLDHSASRPKQESVLTALMLAMDVGPRTQAGQAAWAPGGSGHVGGVSLEKGRKLRCGGPRDAGRARRKPWSQQTLVSPRLWPEGNQTLPVPHPSSRSPIRPSAPRPCSILPVLCPSSRPSVCTPSLSLPPSPPDGSCGVSRLWSHPGSGQRETRCSQSSVCPSLPPLPCLFLIWSPSPCPVDPAVMNPHWRIPPPHIPPEHSRCSVAVRGIALSPVPHCQLAQRSSCPSHLPPQAPAASCSSSASGPHLTRHE